MGTPIAPAQVGDFHQVLTYHHRYWGERDLRSLHLLALVQEFGSTCLVARATAFAEAAERQGARPLKAITSVGNTGSIAFHRSLGFDTEIVDEYNGPGRPMAVFHRDLPLPIDRRTHGDEAGAPTAPVPR